MTASDAGDGWADRLDKSLAAKFSDDYASPDVPGIDWLPRFFPGELAVLAGGVSSGKTALALAMLRAAARGGAAAFFSSIQMASTELYERMVAAESGVHATRLRTATMTFEDTVRVIAAMKTLCELPIAFDDRPAQSVGHIADQACRFADRRPLGLIVVDDLRLASLADASLPYRESLRQASRRLKALAKDMGVPILLLACLSIDDGCRPRLADLHAMGSVGQDADTVLLLHRPDESSDLLEIDVAKQRNGATGRVSVMFRRHLMRFEPGPAPSPFE